MDVPKYARTGADGRDVAPGLPFGARDVRARIDAVEPEKQHDLPSQGEPAVCGGQLVGEPALTVLCEVEPVLGCRV